MYEALRPDLGVWRRVRSAAPAPADVEAAAVARAAGDWRTAAARARTDVDIDLAAVRAAHGTEATARLVDDLRHLALDLLWWHLPRHRGGLTTLRARISAVLAPRSGAARAPLIRVTLPIAPHGPQRLRLSVTTARELDTDRWYFAPRHTWDVRDADGLRAAWGGSADRPPLLDPYGEPRAPGTGDDPAAATERVYARLVDRDIAGAWAATGIELDFDPLSAPDWGSEKNGPPDDPDGPPACPVGVRAAAAEAAAAFGVDRVGTLHHAHLVIEDFTASRDFFKDHDATSPRIAVDRVPADLLLLHAGRITPDDLHPLIARSLFPRRRPADDPAAARPDPAPLRDDRLTLGNPTAEAVRVRCRGAWHRVAIRDGGLRLLDHDDAELRREQVIASLGAASSGCFGIRDRWLGGDGRLPRALAAHRAEVVARIQHGDTDWLLDGLARGTIDPRTVDGHGWSLMHMAMWVDFERLLPVLVRHGIEVDGRDRIGRTPLYLTVMFGGSVRLVRWLLDAGADPSAETVHGANVYRAIERSFRTDLEFVLAPRFGYRRA